MLPVQLLLLLPPPPLLSEPAMRVVHVEIQ